MAQFKHLPLALLAVLITVPTRAAAKKKGLEESDPNRIRRSVRVKAKDAAPEGKQRAPKRKSSSSLVAKRNPVGGKRPAANNKGRTGRG